MTRTNTNVWILGLLCGAVALGACKKRVSATSDDVKNSPDGKACPDNVGMISDGESDNKTNAIKGRGGYWYTFVDNAGSTITPTAGSQGGTFAMSPGGAEGTAHAAHMTGVIGGGDAVYAGMGLNFVDPKGTYDASAYKGISFWAKKGPGSTANVRLKVPDINTDPDGKVCKECFNDFGFDLHLTDDWTQYTLPFSALSQMKGWGSPHTPAIDATKIYGMQFQVNEKGAKFDVWVDNIRFTGCP
jgi:endoglucanase